MAGRALPGACGDERLPEAVSGLQCLVLLYLILGSRGKVGAEVG